MPAFLDIKAGRHNIYALLEVDVTRARRFIDDYETKTGEKLSFTGYLISCLARAVDENKEVQAYRKGNKKLILFDDVDVGFMIELNQGEKRILTGHVIRAANHKTYHQIHQEIRTVQTKQIPPGSQRAAWFRSALLLPWPLGWLFKFFFRKLIRHYPTIVTSMAGTVGISSVGMFGKGHSGWGISAGTHVLDLTVGGISRRLAEVNGRVEGRDILNLTIIFDHELIDGAPAARFTRKLVELIEGGYRLESVPATAVRITEENTI